MLAARLGATYEVPVRPLRLTIVGVKLAFVETAHVYDTAPADAVQIIVGLNATSAAPFAGAFSVGGDGGATRVVNDDVADQALVPAEFVAFTRQ